MDLSSRLLLHGRRVDLITDSKNMHLYSNDKYFSSVYYKKDDLKNNYYDLVIVDSYSTKSMRIKTEIFDTSDLDLEYF